MDRTRKILTAVLALAFLAPAMNLEAAKAKKMKGDDLSDLIIEGENRLKVKGEVPPLQWDPDFYQEFDKELKDERLVSALKAPAIKSPPVTYPVTLRTRMTASPWARKIHRDPLLILTTKPSKKEDKKVEWTFRVKDSKGKVFYEKRKKSILPSSTFSGVPGLETGSSMP